MSFMTSDVQHLFLYLVTICVHSLEKCLFGSFVQFLVKFCLLLSSNMSLYILDTNPLSCVWFTNVFSNYVDSLFILLMVYFSAWKLWMWCSPICYVDIVAGIFGVTSKYHCHDQWQGAFFPMISSKSFNASGLMLQSLIC